MVILRRFALFVVVSCMGLWGLAAAADDHTVSSHTVKKAQEKLKDKGYYTGEVDGVMGPQTRSALWRYEKENNLRTDGRLDRETAQSLGVVSGDAGKTPGDHFEEAGEAVEDHYGKGGKALGHGGKRLGHDVKEGEVGQGAKEFGKGAETFGKEVGKGTGKAAKRIGQGVKDVFDGDEDKDKKKKPN
jgi:peptidoglycan hydrolase-like protein with peptidoglycan-binding domain